MLNVRILTQKVTRMLAQEGIAPICRRALTHLRMRRQRDPFDVENGTETSGLEPLWKLSIDSPNACYGERYEPTKPQELIAVFKFLNLSARDFTFIDLGCGKGRTLIVAARYGFGKVIGVEFAHELAATAQANLATQELTNASVIQADAAHFVFPTGSKVVYLYNPFSSEVLSRVLDNLRVCRDEQLYVVYKSPRCAALLETCGFLKQCAKAPGAEHIAIWQGIACTARPLVEGTT